MDGSTNSSRQSLRQLMDNNQRRKRRYVVDPAILKGHEFTLIDMSESGAKLSSPHKHYKDKKICLQFDIENNSLEIDATVRWCSQSQSIFNTNYLLGVEFTNIPIFKQLIIRNYLSTKSITCQI